MIGAIILFGIFIINWFLWLGKWLGEVGRIAVTNGSLTGVEAFILNNLNFMILMVMLLAIMAWSFFSYET